MKRAQNAGRGLCRRPAQIEVFAHYILSVLRVVDAEKGAARAAEDGFERAGSSLHPFIPAFLSSSFFFFRLVKRFVAWFCFQPRPHVLGLLRLSLFPPFFSRRPSLIAGAGSRIGALWERASSRPGGRARASIDLSAAPRRANETRMAPIGACRDGRTVLLGLRGPFGDLTAHFGYNRSRISMGEAASAAKGAARRFEASATFFANARHDT